MTSYIYCDGGARGNPGPAAAAAVLFNGALEQKAHSAKYLGCATNNVAEYEGILLGLALARTHGLGKITLRLDSELVVRQITGAYKVKHPGLKPLWLQAQAQLKTFAHWEIEHVPREENTAADRLVNLTLDKHV